VVWCGHVHDLATLLLEMRGWRTATAATTIATAAPTSEHTR
jgi:hypothetical protein